MKKGLVVAIVLLSLVGAFAETNLIVSPMPTNSSSSLAAPAVVAAREARVLDIPHGVMLRLLQLDRQISIKIERAKIIIDRIHEYNDSLDTTRLEEILDNMTALHEDLEDHIDNLNVSDINVTEEKEYFIWFKNESLTLVKEFRTELRSLLNDTDFFEQLREEINKVGAERFQQITIRIRTIAREYNAERVKWLARKMGVNNETIQSISNMTREEALRKFRTITSGISREDLNKAVVRVRQEIARERIDAEMITSRINRTKVRKILNKYKVREMLNNSGIGEMLNSSSNGSSINNIIDGVIQGGHGVGGMR